MWKAVGNLLFGQSKLAANFPWDLQTAGKRYFTALFYFAIGSFAIPLLVLAPVFALANYPQMLLTLVDPVGASNTFAIIGLIGGSFGLSAYYLLLRRKGFSFDFSRRLRATSITIISAMLAILVFCLAMFYLDPVFPQVIRWVANLLSTEDGKPRMSFVMGLSAVSFVCGFGMQMRYIAKSLRKEGRSLSESMALNLDSRRGSWWGATAFNLIWPVVVAYLLWQPIGELVVYLMGAAHQPTVELAKAATGGSFLLFALMAAVGAPIFEEIVFRGFLFNIIRSSLSRGHAPIVLSTMPASGSCLMLRQWLIGLRNNLRLLGHGIGARIHSTLKGHPELAAVVISSLLFAVMHLQFNPTTLVLLFLLGCIHAELYRRTGSLYCSILLHAANNGIEVFKLSFGG